MPSDLYWIDTGSDRRLAIMARPRAGDWLEDEIDHWKRSGVAIVVSLLEREEVADLGLEEEAAICARNGIDFLSFPIPDRMTPADVAEAMRFAAATMAAEKAVAIHCRAGIGRSSIMAAAMLVSESTRPDAALAAIAEARGPPVPDTEAQRRWVLTLTPQAD
jgi:protein-tyrosine phosphatase